ncbi:unnamed protein product [Mytilus coruscus]|uniref:Uncharacterized protein n=1 Tax=Mytilus coruscus TaxID=42192 RepID=A0A6J8CK03_MYTCO|nr:unnamed protein product [Mytilus coruscus]
MEEVEIEIKQNFVDLNPSHRRFNDERSEYVKKFTETSNHKHDTNEVEKLENENSYDSEWGDLNIEWADHELCSDLTELSDWDDLDNNEEKEDTHYKDDFLGYEDFLAYEETDEAKRNVRFLLYSYEAAIHKLFQCYRYIRVKEFEIIAQEILLVKIEDLQAVFNEYMSRFFVGGRKHEYCDSDRLVGLFVYQSNLLHP